MLRLENRNLGFFDMYGARLRGSQRLTCELTVRDGKVVYDLNGITRQDWDKLPKDYRASGDPRWDATTSYGGGTRRADQPQQTKK